MTHNQEASTRRPEDGEPINPQLIADALTRSPFTYEDGTTQVFDADGNTTFTERDGRPTRGEWVVDENGRFWSFWPPSYRAEYDVTWIVDAERPVGVRFTERARGTVSLGRYTGQ